MDYYFDEWLENEKHYTAKEIRSICYRIDRIFEITHTQDFDELRFDVFLDSEDYIFMKPSTQYKYRKAYLLFCEFLERDPRN